MSLSRQALVAFVCAGAGVAGCGGGRGDAAPAPRTPTARTAAVAPARPPAVAVKTLATRYGRILVDRNGRTLYLFTRETGPRSRCYGACAEAWPPLLVGGTPGAGLGVNQRLLGTIRRSDGKSQVTYRGHPHYHYVSDLRPGQILCQAAPEFGGIWYVVSPAGTAIR